MQIIQDKKTKLITLIAEEGKVIKRKQYPDIIHSFYITLAKDDTIDNYEEVDIVQQETLEDEDLKEDN